MGNTVKERLLQFISNENIEKARFEKESGLSNGFVDKVGSSIRSKSLDKIRKRFPHLSISWLLTGEGNMLNTGNISVVGDSNISNTGVIEGGVVLETNQEIKLLRAKVKELEAEVKELKNDKVILQNYIALLQNKRGS